MSLKERPQCRKAIEILAEKHSCGLEELPTKCFLFRGTQIQLKKMIDENNGIKKIM